MGEGNGKAQKKKKRRGKVDKESKKLRKEIGGALKSFSSRAGDFLQVSYNDLEFIFYIYI